MMIGVEVTGATYVTPSGSVRTFVPPNDPGIGDSRLPALIMLTRLNPGVHTFTLRYKRGYARVYDWDSDDASRTAMTEEP